MVPADNTALEHRGELVRQAGRYSAMINALSGGLHEARSLPARLLHEPHCHLLSSVTHY